MKKDEIFFGEKGLTSTSANHIADIAKELYKGIEEELNETRFYNTTVSAVNGANSTPVSFGKDEEFVSTIAEKIEDVAKLKSLIAWLREAIKARENMLREVRMYTVAKYIKDNGIECPQMPLIEAPERGHMLSEDEYYGNLSIANRNRYYELQAKAAAIGKYIHNDGCITSARDMLNNKKQRPVDVTGKDANCLIYTYLPTVSIEKVDEMFFNLEAKHREYQKELNSIKFECEKACNESKIKVEAEYREAVNAYNVQQENARNKYMDEMKRLEALVSEYQTSETTRISNLKIIIPDNLKGIYEKVNSVGHK